MAALPRGSDTMPDSDYGPALNHYRNQLAEAWGVKAEDIELFLIEPGDSGAGASYPPKTTFTSPYDWMDENLREAASRLAMVQLYAEYGEYGQEVVAEQSLVSEVLDQAVQIVAFTSEHWDEVYSWVLGYNDAMEEIWGDEGGEDGDGDEGEELDVTEWEKGGMDWPEED